METELFFNTLYHDKPATDHILIWEMTRKPREQKLSFWFNNVSDAINHFHKQGANQDTYVGCGTAAMAMSSFQRCKKEDISGISAAWLDVDILNPVHSKPNLPETPEKAMEIISGFPLAPTMIVHSGHGYQFWWVFKNFIHFRDAHERQEASTLIDQFTWTMRDKARSMGYDIDRTHDLSRVMRIPGGLNHKDDPPLPVRLEQCGQNYYTPVEFRDALKSYRLSLGEIATPYEEARKTTPTASQVVRGEHFTLNPMAEPPQDKFEALVEFEPKFLASWKRQRKDFKSGDESASVYDLSLASFAFGAEWEPQEVVDLLIAFRRTNGLKEKLVESYYKRTLAAASNAMDKVQAFEDLKDFVEDDNDLPDPALSPEENAVKRQEKINAAKVATAKLLKVKVRRVVKFDINPAEYKLELDNTYIHLGAVQNLIEQNLFRRKLADATGVYLSPMKADKWNIVANALLALCETVSVGDDTSAKGQVRFWLTNFLELFEPLYDQEEGLANRRPYYYGNSLYFFGPDLRNYIAMYWKELLNPKAMGIMLKEYGATPETKNIKVNGKYNTKSVWRLRIADDKVAQQFCNYELLKHATELVMESQNEKKGAPEGDLSP